MNRRHLHQIPDVLITRPEYQQLAMVQLLDDLDIRGCPECEELRYQVIAWVHAHSPVVRAQRKARQERGFPPLSVPRKKNDYRRRDREAVPA